MVSSNTVDMYKKVKQKNNKSNDSYKLITIFHWQATYYLAIFALSHILFFDIRALDLQFSCLKRILGGFGETFGEV